MPGVLLRLIPKQTLTVPITANTIMVVKGIDVSQYREATLLVRIHPGGTNSGATLTFRVYIDGPTQEDPATDFFPATDLANATAPSTAAFNTVALLTNALGSSNLGGYLRLHVISGGSGSASTAVISVDLSAKS
jgi:hypothetical protein